MRTRRVSYSTYARNEPFWLGLQAKGTQIEVTRNGRVDMILFGEPEVCEETSLEKIRRNKLYIAPTRRAA